MSIALIRSSVAAAMKTRPLAVTTGPPLFGGPISSGMKVGRPNGPFRRARPNGPFPRARTERAIPQRFAGGEIDRADASIRRSCTEHAGRHLPSRVDEDAIGRSRLRTRSFGTRGTSRRTGIAGGEQAHRVRLLAAHEHVL